MQVATILPALYCFYSDNGEGIKSQVWAALIANLLFTVIHKQIKECEQFTTIVAISSNNLGSYVCLLSILKEKSWMKRNWILAISSSQFQYLIGGCFLQNKKKPLK